MYSSHTDALISQLIDQIAAEKNISKQAAETYLNTSGLRIYSTQVESIQNTIEAEMEDPKYILPLTPFSNLNPASTSATAVSYSSCVT